MLIAWLVDDKGEDPLDGKLDNDDINSVAGLLKLYFRELKEPLFPSSLFDQLVACSQRYNVNGLLHVLICFYHSACHSVGHQGIMFSAGMQVSKITIIESHNALRFLGLK